MRWQPAHETHAIERVTVSLMFSEAISTKPWQTLLSLATGELTKLGFQAAPDAMPIPQNITQGAPGVAQFIINIGPSGSSPSNVGGSIPASRTFQYIVGGEAQDEVVIGRNMFLFTTPFYGGWDNLRKRLSKTLSINLSLALNSVDINSIKLEYWDRFVSDDEPDAATYEDLLRNSSKYVPQFGFGTKDLWHSHVGLFEEPGSSSKRLVNLNIDVVDIAEISDGDGIGSAPIRKRSVGIYSMIQDTLKAVPPLTSADGAYSTLDEMHTILKVVLADAITDAAAARIALNP